MSDLFPLPVSPFEYYYLCDDRPEYPTTFFLELSFRGPLARGPLEGALALVLERHPLLTARLDMNGGGRPNWLAGAGPTLDWGDNDEPLLAPNGLGIDLVDEPGLRLWARSGESSSKLMFQFHHACCDGLAAGRFAEELLLAYHALFDASGPPLPPLDRERLKFRDEPDPADPKPTWRDAWNTAAFWTRVLARPPVVIAGKERANAFPASGPVNLSELCPVHSATLTVNETRHLRRAAAEQGATFNDILLRDLFLALAQWNAEHGAAGPLRINVPAVRREKFNPHMPAANTLGFTFLTRRIRLNDEPAPLLHSIQRETAEIKRTRAGRYFLGGLAFACGIPGLVPWALRRERCFATAVLSNLGRIGARTPLPLAGRKAVVGQAVLEGVAGVPPIRPQTRASFAVFQYAGETTIALQCDPRFFTRETTQDLLACYVDRLRLTRAAGVGDAEEEASTLAPITPAEVS